MLTLGDKYDLVCPSDYLIMKLMKEEAVVPFSDEFFDESNEDNYYVKGVSPYIRNVFDENEINGESWSKYAAGYMWGLTGILYNPEYVSYDEASTWAIINNPKFSRQVTVKDLRRTAVRLILCQERSLPITSGQEMQYMPWIRQRRTV